ncbi:MAG: PKD domain-containing protein [bacterium]
MYTAQCRLTPSLFILAALTVVLASCGSGSGGTTPPPNNRPAVNRVAPAAPSAVTGARIRFMANASAGVDRWSWNFGNGATPATSTVADPEITFGAVGSYVATVSACIGEECSNPTEFRYVVLPVGTPDGSLDPPYITNVTPTGTLGLEGATITFSAASQGDISAWEWHFGDGAIPATALTPAPMVHLRAPGLYEGSVRVRNAAGWSGLFAFAYAVAKPSTPGPDPDPDPDPDLDPPTEAPIVLGVRELSGREPVACDGKPLAFVPTLGGGRVEHYDWIFPESVTPSITQNSIARVSSRVQGNYEGLLRVSNRIGSAEYPFTVGILWCPDITAVVIEDDQLPGGMVKIEGKPGPGFNSYGGGIRRESNPGTFSGKLSGYPAYDWWTRTSTGPLEGSYAFSLLPEWGDGDIGPVMAEVTQPSPAPVFRPIIAVPDSLWNQQVATRVIDGRVLVIYPTADREQLRCSRALTSDPQSAADWSAHTIFEQASTMGFAVLGAAGERAIYAARNGTGRIQVWTASTVTPSALSDWTTFLVATSSDNPQILMREDGRLLIRFNDSDASTCTFGLTPQNPQQATDVEWATLDLPGMPSNGGQSLQALGSGIVFLYYADSTDRRMAVTADVPGALTGTAWSIYELPLDADVNKLDPFWLTATSQRYILIVEPSSYQPCRVYSAAAPAPVRDEWVFGGELSGIPNGFGIVSATEIDGYPVICSNRYEGVAFLYSRTTAVGGGKDWQFTLGVTPEQAALGFFLKAEFDGRQVYVPSSQIPPSGADSLVLYRGEITW